MIPVELAHWRNAGVDYSWTLLRRIAPLITPEGKLAIGLHVHARNKWQQALEAEKKPWYLLNEKDVIALDVPLESEGLDAVLKDIYDEALSLGKGGDGPQLLLGSRPLSKQEIEAHVASGTPRQEAERINIREQRRADEISYEAWRGAVERYLLQEEKSTQ